MSQVGNKDGSKVSSQPNILIFQSCWRRILISTIEGAYHPTMSNVFPTVEATSRFVGALRSARTGLQTSRVSDLEFK